MRAAYVQRGVRLRRRVAHVALDVAAARQPLDQRHALPAWGAIVTILYIGNTHLLYIIIYKASRGAAAQSVTVKPTGYGFDPHSR